MSNAKGGPCATAVLAMIGALTVLGGCNDNFSSAASTEPSPKEFTIGGTVSGLANGASFVLRNNQASSLTISANGTFTFAPPVVANGFYGVTVERQPAGQTCTVSNGSGSGVTANVSNVTVVCSIDSYIISGSVSGLGSGMQVVLGDNGADATTVAVNGNFAFRTQIAYNGSYAVTVENQPAGETCTVSNGTGAGVAADVSNVAVMCSANSYSIGGMVSGLGVGLQVTLDNNSSDPVTLAANGVFTFGTHVVEQGSYNVTVGTQPIGQICTVTNGTGSGVSNDVSDVAIGCSTRTFTIGGSVSGLPNGAQVTLNNNGADPKTVAANGAFTFTTPVAYNSSYTVTVGTQPGGQYCAVLGGSGAQVAADVNTVAVSCSTNPTTFSAAGNYTWTVPIGVTSVQIVATGGGGGGGGMYGTNPSQPGGAGALVTSTLAVTGGQILNLTVGGGGGSGSNGPGTAGSYTCGAGGGGGGSSNVDAGSGVEIFAGGGGGGGGCNNATAGGAGGGSGGVGSDGGAGFQASGGHGGSGGLGGLGATPGRHGSYGVNGSNGSGGAGGHGGANGGSLPGGSGGTSVGTGTGGSAGNGLSGGGGGGYGGGGSGTQATGGGAGGSTGPAGSLYAPASNGGASATNGGDGSIVITIQ